ncbi:MAG: hypothetical protein KDD69_15880 [Bdellovibrionales bacterium]|nr:hypothetical protein [Bdellovibrionales bacterium]
MDSRLSADIATQQNAAGAVGKNVQLEASPTADTQAVRLRSLGLLHLAQLTDGLEQGTIDSPVLKRLSRPVELKQLEMLEAELTNQGILPRLRAGVLSLAQHVAQETGVWCWRAERCGVESNSLQFDVEIPRYIIARAGELLAPLSLDTPGPVEPQTGVWRRAAEAPAVAIAELSYLDRFAAYLLGAFYDPANRYQRGLNLVLHVLVGAARAEEEQSSLLCLTLPLSKQAFFHQLKAGKGS